MRMNIFKIFLLFVFTITMVKAQGDNTNSITVKELKEKLNSDKELVLIDVRTPEELTGPLGKIDQAINIPLNELASRINELQKYKDDDIVVICRTQNRSASAADYLNQNGFKSKYVLGGMTAFRQK